MLLELRNRCRQGVISLEAPGQAAQSPVDSLDGLVAAQPVLLDHERYDTAQSRR